jgi:hypothetical protein
MNKSLEETMNEMYGDAPIEREPLPVDFLRTDADMEQALWLISPATTERSSQCANTRLHSMPCVQSSQSVFR